MFFVLKKKKNKKQFLVVKYVSNGFCFEKQKTLF